MTLHSLKSNYTVCVGQLFGNKFLNCYLNAIAKFINQENSGKCLNNIF